MGIRIALHDGPRSDLRELFELAEDSPAQLDAYLNLGRVLVAIDEHDIVGHLQIVHGPGAGQCEVKNMAVRASHQRRGIGRTLVEAAIDLVAAESCKTLLVATAAADIGNLRFYQRLGFGWRGSTATRTPERPATPKPSTSTGSNSVIASG